MTDNTDLIAKNKEKVLAALRQGSVEKLTHIYRLSNKDFNIDTLIGGETALFIATRHLSLQNLPVVMCLLNLGANPVVPLGPESREILDRNSLINLWEKVLSGNMAENKKSKLFSAFILAHQKSNYTAQDNTNLLISTLQLYNGEGREQIIEYLLGKPLDFNYTLKRNSCETSLIEACMGSRIQNVWVVEKLSERELSSEVKERFLKVYQMPVYYDTASRLRLEAVMEKFKLDLSIPAKENAQVKGKFKV